MTQLVYRVAIGIIRDADNILLVRQRGPDDPAETWALPGGVVQDGELLSEALIREVREETGLTIGNIGKLAYLTQLDNQAENTQSLASVFLVDGWTGTLQSVDPDSLVTGAAFFPTKEAILKLASLPWRHMCEPAIAYLQKRAATGTVWLYRQGHDGTQRLVTRL